MRRANKIATIDKDREKPFCFSNGIQVRIQIGSTMCSFRLMRVWYLMEFDAVSMVRSEAARKELKANAIRAAKLKTTRIFQQLHTCRETAALTVRRLPSVRINCHRSRSLWAARTWSWSSRWSTGRPTEQPVSFWEDWEVSSIEIWLKSSFVRHVRQATHQISSFSYWPLWMFPLSFCDFHT